jgi:hypothetical protein
MHMMVHKEPGEKAKDPDAGRRLFETSLALLNRVPEKRA